MGKKYFVLMVREDGEWSQEFGDYEKSVVKDELQDKRDYEIGRDHADLVQIRKDINEGLY